MRRCAWFKLTRKKHNTDAYIEHVVQAIEIQMQYIYTCTCTCLSASLSLVCRLHAKFVKQSLQTTALGNDFIPTELFVLPCCALYTLESTR